MVTVLLGNAMNLLWHDHSLSWTEPIASSIAFVLGGLSAPPPCFMFHGGFICCFAQLLVYVPQSKHAHLIAGPANVFLSRLDSKGKLEKSILPMRRKKATASERLKTSAALSLSTFTPASNALYKYVSGSGTGKMLSPMDLILKLRDHLTEKGAAVTSKSPRCPRPFFSTRRRISSPRLPQGRIA